jgi:uracil-DNA glycosylase
MNFNMATCDSQWLPILDSALDTMDKDYLSQLKQNTNWLPGPEYLFSAFSLPLQNIRYVLMGESPYPRAASANGYAFWDAAVGDLWSPTGFSKAVNRATSLRNWIKMLLVARGDLNHEVSQEAISYVDKSPLTPTAKDFFCGMMHQGIILLNASLVYSEGKVPFHARHWAPFMQSLFSQLVLIHPKVELILLGKIAKLLPKNQLTVGLQCEHPYNVSYY